LLSDEKCFEQLTGDQLSRFKISGKSVRQVKGYSVNITETCDDTDEQKDKPNLIVNVQVKGASAADNDYLKDEELIVTHIERGEINGGLPPRVRANSGILPTNRQQQPN